LYSFETGRHHGYRHPDLTKARAGPADNVLVNPRNQGAAVTIGNSAIRDPRAGESDRDAVIRKLSLEVAVGDVRLPSLPDIAVRVQQVLEDPKAARTRVAQVISADAALAARILRLANSAFFNPSTQQIFDLQQAITRLGTQLVRCTAMSFSLQQMEFGKGDAQLRPHIRELWRRGALVAAIAYVLARETRAAKPDEALMTGLMHNIGDLYITVATPGRAGGGESDGWEQLVREWHPRIAGSILKHWKFPPAIIDTVVNQHSADHDSHGEASLTDILIAAIALGSCVFQRDLLDDAVTTAPSFQRLQLGSADCNRLLASAAVQIKALRAALTS
jgi:HD-like signal output (HDOD) protein